MTILRYESLESTNTTLVEMVRLGRVEPGTVILADEQTAGRGRQGRIWNAEPGTSLLCSVYIVAAHAKEMAYAACGLAVRDSIKSIVHVQPDIKWPNDILLGGKKVCGILVMATELGIVAGFGVNVNMDPIQLARIGPEATSLMVAAGMAVNRETLLTELLVNLNAYFKRSAQYPKSVFGDWREALITIGQHVEVETASGGWVGRATDVLDDGALLVTRGEHVVPVYAADVRLRPISGSDFIDD